jgi:aquaporin Z
MSPQTEWVEDPRAHAVRGALTHHWKEYAIEAAALAYFMIAACAFATILQQVADPVMRRGLMGLAMGATAVSIFYSPWGRRSGAHINPSVTLTFFRLGRVAPWDAVFYVLAQFAGAVIGVGVAYAALGRRLAAPSVRFAVTAPGMHGIVIAFAAEAGISAFLFWCVLTSAASPRWKRFTGLIAGSLVATYIFVESPLSGMSMNPARSFGSAFVAGAWDALWIYFIAPPIGMLLAAELFLRRRPGVTPPCAKMCHVDGEPCLFCASREAGT